MSLRGSHVFKFKFLLLDVRKPGCVGRRAGWLSRSRLQQSSWLSLAASASEESERPQDTLHWYSATICKLVLYNKVCNIVKHEKYCEIWWNPGNTDRIVFLILYSISQCLQIWKQITMLHISLQQYFMEEFLKIFTWYLSIFYVKCFVFYDVIYFVVFHRKSQDVYQ